MQPMLLGELMRAEPNKRVRGRLNRSILDLAYEVGQVRTGAAYFAMWHGDADGHDRVMEAIQRGAGAIVCERGGFIPPRAVSIRVPDSRLALARAAARFHGHPSQTLRVLGVTGGGDLPGFAFLLHALLERTGAATGLIGSLEHLVGDRVLPPQAAGEETLEVQRMLASMLRHGQERAVVELGPVARRHGWATGLTLRTLIQLPRAADEGANPPAPFLAQERLELEWCGEGRIVRVVESDGSVRFQVEVRRLETGLRGSVIRLRTPDGLRTLHTPLVGRQPVRLLVAAAVVAAALGAPWLRIARAVRRIPAAPGRLEPVLAGQPFPVLVDGAESPRALLRVLREARALGPRRILLLAGGAAGQSPATWQRLGRVAALAADRALITTHSPRRKSPEAIAATVLAGARATGAGSVADEPDRAGAIARLIDEAGPDDLVLLTGKGHRARQELDHCVIPFDDRTHARLILEERAWPESPEGPAGPRILRP